MIAAFAFAFALSAAASDVTGDPADPATAPAELVYPAAPAPEPERAVIGGSPSASDDPSVDGAVNDAELDPLEPCKRLVLDRSLVRIGTDDREKLGEAEQCFRDRAAKAPEGDAVIARALAMADVIAAWRLAEPALLVPSAPPVSAPKNATLSVSELVESGRAEALVHGALAGAGGGFLLAGAIFSTTRASEQDTLPWLLASPALGALAGTAGTWALLDATEPTTGDIAFATSTMWVGAAEGIVLQLAIFDGSREASSVPLRFITVLGGGAVGLAAGAALAPLVDVTPGDAAVANSALLWGGVMTGFGLGYVGSNGSALAFGPTMLVLAAGSTVPYVAVLAAHPLLEIERWPSLLIEAGGAAGFLTSVGAMVVLNNGGGFGQQGAIVLMGAGTLAGVGLGATAAWIVSANMEPSTSVDVPAVSFAPALLPDPTQASIAMPGLVVGGRF